MKVVAERMREVVADRQVREAVVRRQNLVWLRDNPTEQMDVEEVINKIKEYDKFKGWETLKEDLFRFGGAGFAGDAKPTEAIRLLKKARTEGKDFENLSQLKTDALFLESRLLSLNATVSHLKCWRECSMEVLGYAKACTLPPRSSQHMLMFINIFHNGKSAVNYVGSVRWAGKMRELDESWDQPIVIQVLRGSKKMTLRLLGAKLDLRKVLTDDTVSRLVVLSDNLGTREWSEFLLMGWEYLMRIQSECIPLECGCSEEATQLSLSRHSTVFHDGNGNLVVRWTRRKNRPRGSLLRRKCVCDKRSLQLCVSCKMRTRLSTLEVGEKIWTFTQSQARSKMLRYLTLLGVDEAQGYTFKAIRAGKATQMAA